jgi:hypothetical protein
MRRRRAGKGLILGGLASVGALISRRAIGAPLLNQEAERIQRDLEAEIPKGSDEAVIRAAFQRRGWEPMFDPILNNYGFLIKKNTGKDGILVRVWLDNQRHANRIEVKAVYWPVFG